MTAETGRYYQLYGLQIRSLIPLRAPQSRLLGGEGTSPIQITAGYPLRADGGPCRGRAGVRVYPHRQVAVYSDNQGHAMCFARDKIVVAGDLSDAGQQFYLLKCLMPMVAGLEGNCLLHASAFAVDGEAIVIVGASGHGKSTLATLAEQYGAEHLADDVVAVHREGDRCFVLPSGAGKLLLSGVVNELETRGFWVPGAAQYQLGQKFWYPECTAREKSLYPISRLVFLRRYKDAHHEAVDDALKALITGTLGPLDFGRHLGASHLPLFSNLLRTVPYSFVTAATTVEKMNNLVAALISSAASVAQAAPSLMAAR